MCPHCSWYNIFSFAELRAVQNYYKYKYECFDCKQKFNSYTDKKSCPFCGSEHIKRIKYKTEPYKETGKYGEYQPIVFDPRFSPDHFIYKPYRYIKHGHSTYAILKTLADVRDKGMSFGDIRAYSSVYDVQDAGLILKRLRVSGLVIKTERGWYKITDEGISALSKMETENIWKPDWRL
jgi:predicted transcriptional regulator